MYTVLKLFWPFEGHRKADVAPSENEFDTPALSTKQIIRKKIQILDFAIHFILLLFHFKTALSKKEQWY